MKPKGFTIIELLMVVIIITLILTAGTFSYSNQRRQVEFNDAVFKINSMIKTARNYAVTSRSSYDADCRPVGQETFVPPEGYGVYIEQTEDPGTARFVLFANTKADSDVTRNQFEDPEVYGACDSDLIQEEYLLRGKAAFSKILTLLTPTETLLSSYSNALERKAVILYKTAMADTTLAANDHPAIADNLTLPVDLYLVFERPAGGAGTAKNTIHISRLAGFPEILTQ